MACFDIQSIGFNTPLAIQIFAWEKNVHITQACRKLDRVRAATAAETILAARRFSSPMFSARPAMNVRGSSPSISTAIVRPTALKFLLQCY